MQKTAMSKVMGERSEPVKGCSSSSGGLKEGAPECAEPERGAAAVCERSEQTAGERPRAEAEHTEVPPL